MERLDEDLGKGDVQFFMPFATGFSFLFCPDALSTDRC